jgi:hypothetical protein
MRAGPDSSCPQAARKGQQEDDKEDDLVTVASR